MSTTPLQNGAENVTVDRRLRVLLYAVRQALIIALGAIEDFLEVERSIVPRHKRRRSQDVSQDAPGFARIDET